jgi:hypothetical protein
VFYSAKYEKVLQMAEIAGKQQQHQQLEQQQQKQRTQPQ